MAKKVIVSPRAERNIEKIAEYLFENWSAKLVEEFIERYEECFDLISKKPQLYPIVRNAKQVRRCIMTKHNLIYFKEFPDRITIITIFDTRQNPKKLNKIL